MSPALLRRAYRTKAKLERILSEKGGPLDKGLRTPDQIRADIAFINRQIATMLLADNVVAPSSKQYVRVPVERDQLAGLRSLGSGNLTVGIQRAIEKALLTDGGTTS